ncbi:major facilitator superfamily domain-containing protein [Pseudomassariella vexata]|uniref:Major facilitator superfamily domain-containing protein n=1 Tax=Pseudomassariella vexata TaxID=1141098 RepID=A0A1Y2EA99_9PEZI|nr:major facilitator superfamily domain-containing protein [Pseudomassariella vexata]ORY68176.1 major facilitator superfamily domain-containing protein [Pseudomassariella vexata]
MSQTNPPRGLRWRSSTTFIIATVAVGLFTDLFLYGLVVPVLPFMLRNRMSIPDEEIQSYVSSLLAAYAGASVVSAVPAGWIADRTDSRQTPFLSGLAALLAATIMLASGDSIAVLVVARILQGISAAVVWTIGLAMVLDTVGPQDLGKVIGSIFSFISVGDLLAPVLGGVLYDKTGYTGVFGVASAVLALDFIMRLLIVEKKTAAKYKSAAEDDETNPRDFGTRNDPQDEEASEEDALLPKKEDDAYNIHGEPGSIVRALPILYCFRNPRLLVGLSLSFVQASLLAMFDATIPTEAHDLFGFSSLQAGLLFIALDIPYLILGPIAGWTVDRFGTKPAAVIGFGFLVPVLVLLRLPSAKLVDGSGNIVLYCAMLALNGVGLAIIGSPSIVEASDVVQKYDKANPEFFGANGPYAQLYGFSSLFFSAGLTMGPIVSGALRDSIGYGNMNLVFAVVSGITAILSFFVIGGKPKVLSGARG